MERVRRHLFLFLILGLVCYAGLTLLGDFDEVRAALRSFPLSRLPLLLGLASANYLLRFVRWQGYLKALGIAIGYGKSFQIFMAGLTMTTTPGKVGEALKAQLLKGETEDHWSKGLPIVFAERLLDLAAIVLLAGLGLTTLHLGMPWVLVGAGICLILVVVSVQPTVFGATIRLLGGVPGADKLCERLLEMHGHVRSLMTLRVAGMALFVSCLAWFAGCLVLYFALSSYHLPLGHLRSVFIYSLATLAGALSFLPGGLVVTEGSMTGLLVLSGVAHHQAVAVTMIVRICTLWFAVLLGLIFLISIQTSRKLGDFSPMPETPRGAVGKVHGKPQMTEDKKGE